MSQKKDITDELTKIIKESDSLIKNNDIAKKINFDKTIPEDIHIPDVSLLYEKINNFHEDLLYEIYHNEKHNYNQKNINDSFEKNEKSFLNYQLLKKDIFKYEAQLLGKKTDYQYLLVSVDDCNDEIFSIRKKIQENKNEFNTALLELQQHKNDFDSSDYANSAEHLEKIDLNNSSNLRMEDSEDHPLYQIYLDFSIFSEGVDSLDIDLNNDLNVNLRKIEDLNGQLVKFNESFLKYKTDFISKVNNVDPFLKDIEKNVNLFLNSSISLQSKLKNKKTI